MWWWHQNGDSVVLDGVTIALSGTGIQNVDGAVQDPPGSGDATLTFSFSPPIESFQMHIRSVGPTESIQFQAPFPNWVQGLSLVPSGTPIQSVRGFFLNDDNAGAVTWNGPGLTSVTFTMSHADGTILLTQMGQAFSASLGNSIVIDATPTPAGTLINLAISDAGGAPGIQSFVLQRRTIYPCAAGDWQTVHCIIPRTPGTVAHLMIPDTNVHPGTQYVYRMAGGSIPCLADLSQGAFVGAFDPTGWGFEILSFVSTGPQPVPIAHGRIVADGSEGPAFVRVEQCTDSCNSYAYGFASPEVLQYAGTATEVTVYGSVSWAGNYYGWMSSFESAEPLRCTVAVRHVTWSHVKSLYQDPAAGSR